MGLKIYNQRPKSDYVTGLYLSPLAEIKSCVASIGGGTVMANIAFTAFKFAATPIIITAGLTAIAFLGAVDFIQDKMTARAMNNGEVSVKTHRRSKLDL